MTRELNKTVSRLPCPCGTHRPPRIYRRGPASLLAALRCPVCGFKSAGGRPEDIERNWNDAVRGRIFDRVRP